ncbi:hypothetical protein, partial [Pseudomonas shirazensis]
SAGVPRDAFCCRRKARQAGILACESDYSLLRSFCRVPAAASVARQGFIAGMNGWRSLSSRLIPSHYKMTGKSGFHLFREDLTTPTFSENVCVPKSNGRMN